MTFVFPAILAGLALISIPVLIHLIMRQKPRTLPFPAFRFLLQRHRTNLRKLRLRHLLLLALRILVLAAICLALARPRLFHTGLISREQPLAAVLIFDTSLSMEYKTSDGQSRLDEAKKRGLELIDELPEGSRVVVLDGGENVPASKGLWLTTLGQARERIKNLRLRPANAPVTQRLEDAYRLLAELARNGEDESARVLPRFVFLFSDRTRGSWQASRLPNLYEQYDQVPPFLSGLQQAQADIPGLVDLLRELRAKLPPGPGQDYPDQALIDGLGTLREKLAKVTAADLPPDAELHKRLADVRRWARVVFAAVPDHERALAQAKLTGGAISEEIKFGTRVRTGLNRLLRMLGGAEGIFIDVGIDSPVDLALVDVLLPKDAHGQTREIFGDDEIITLQTLVRAIGKDHQTAIEMHIGAKSFQANVDVKADQQVPVPFEIDLPRLKLGPGTHQITIRSPRNDQVSFNNSRYLTIALREPRPILVLTEDPAKAEVFGRALDALKYRAEIKHVREAAKLDLGRYQAVYLFEVAAPEPTLWTMLAAYVQRGRGLGIVPAGPEMEKNLVAFNQGAAQQVMPAALEKIITFTHKDKQVQENGVPWDLQGNIVQHPLLKPFAEWRGNRQIDFIAIPYLRSALSYWEVKPLKDAHVLVRYDDDKTRPALVERLIDRGQGKPGKVLLFTTPLDERQPPWTHYLKEGASFYLTLVGVSTRYLAGETETARFNFVSGQEHPVVVLPLTPSAPAYLVRGPDLMEQIPRSDQQSDLIVKQATAPGNYTVEGVGADPSGQVASFSVNMPASESDLTRVPAGEIEPLLGAGAIVPVDRKLDLKDALQGHWDQPIELLPFLLVLLLLVLAVENLLANKFYRREEAPA